MVSGRGWCLAQRAVAACALHLPTTPHARIEPPALDPLWGALFPSGKLTLGCSNLFSQRHQRMCLLIAHRTGHAARCPRVPTSQNQSNRH